MDDELDPREAARNRRRDHDLEAERRGLMQTGLAKVFKQIRDAQVRYVTDPLARRRRHQKRTD
jgi:hypothetical protein